MSYRVEAYSRNCGWFPAVTVSSKEQAEQEYRRISKHLPSRINMIITIPIIDADYEQAKKAEIENKPQPEIIVA